MQKTMERAGAGTGAQPGGYGTIIVHAEPGLASSHRVEAAGRLARDLGARLIGVGAEAYDAAFTMDPVSGFQSAQWISLIQEQIDRNLAAAEAAFRRDAGGADLEWRQFQDHPHRALIGTARAADLIVVGPRGAGGSARTCDPADVVMTAGRPVLVAPDGRQHLQGDRVVVAWKDTRECRRAIGDAMPFLRRAQDVVIHAVCKDVDTDVAVFETDDVVGNLKRRGVAARQLVTNVEPERVTEELQRVAALTGADLIVAGAFGHSRLREWALGGVSDDLLRRPTCFALLSH